MRDQNPPMPILMHALLHLQKRKLYATERDYGPRPAVLIRTSIPCLIGSKHF